MTMFNITTTASDQVRQVTVTSSDGTVTEVLEDGSYESATAEEVTVEIILEAGCPADGIAFSEGADSIDLRLEGSGSAPVSVPMRLSMEVEVSAVHWHKGYTTKVSKTG